MAKGTVAASPKATEILAEPPGRRRDFQDHWRIAHFKGLGRDKAWVASRLQRPVAWVSQRWDAVPPSSPPPSVPAYIARHAELCALAGVEPFRPPELRRGYFQPSASALAALRRLPWTAAPVLKRDYATGEVLDTGMKVAREACSSRCLRLGVPCVDEAIARLVEEYSINDPAAYLLCNRYADGRASIAAHQHDFWSATISIGATRTFQLDSQELRLASGDVLVFGNQRHSVPKTEEAVGERFSVSIFWYPEWREDWYAPNEIEAWQLEKLQRAAWAEQRGKNAAQLQSMGFGEVAALEALDEAQGSLEVAAELLLLKAPSAEPPGPEQRPAAQPPAEQGKRAGRWRGRRGEAAGGS